MFYIENEVRVSSAIVKYRDFTIQGNKVKLWGFQPLAVKLTTKSDISFDYRPSATARLVVAGSN